MRTPLDVANYFIEYSGFTKTQLQIQKMTYIAHGYMLALHNKDLVSEIPEAWDHGPVFPSLWKNFRKWGTGVIGQIKYSTINGVFDPNELNVLKNVFSYYGRLCGYFLSDITHNNSHEITPWKQCYIQGEKHIIIPNEITKKYYIDLYNKRGYDY